IKVNVSYKPTHPMPHHRRVACLILLREPLFLDLIGTCHPDFQKPVALTLEHLVEYKYKLCCMSNSSDTQLGAPLPTEEVKNKNKQEKTKQIFQFRNSATVIPPAPMEKSNEIREGHVDSLFTPSFPFVSTEPSELLFNHKATSFIATSSAVSQCVTFKNHTKEKLSLMWTVIQDSPFCVTPSSFELAPLKSTTALVTYEPRQINTLHGGELECFAYCKVILHNSNLPFSQVQTWTFSPLTEKTYAFKPSLRFQSDDFNKSSLSFKVEGIGAAGTIQVCLSLCFVH
uniref:CFAP65 fourth Ig-like domain-containing protein n=1 Tax=Poecilia mexicana TaxID=48701 RepID=A0A3B3WHW7_9TELE